MNAPNFDFIFLTKILGVLRTNHIFFKLIANIWAKNPEIYGLEIEDIFTFLEETNVGILLIQVHSDEFRS